MKKSFPLLCAFLAIGSAVLRLYHLGHADYWIDEMSSLNIARQQTWSSLFSDNNPPLYHLILRGWIRLFGEGEFATRSLSVLFSSLATLVLMRLGYVLKGYRGAITFGLLHAFCFLSIRYAQETRMYALLELGSTLSVLSFYFLKQSVQSTKAWILFVTTSILVLTTHYLGFLLIALESGLLFFSLSNLSRVRLAVAVVSFAGLIAYFYFRHFSWEGLEWQRRKFGLEVQSRWPTELIWLLVNQSWIAALGVCTILFNRGRALNAIAGSFWIMGLTPIGLAFFASLFLDRAVLIPRYFIEMLPVILTGLGLSFLNLERKTFAFSLVLFVSGSAIALPHAYESSKEPWKKAADLISSYPPTLILTTRTPSIRTPYFESFEVEKWDPQSIEGQAYLMNQVMRRHRVWILENYWGGDPYMRDLEARLKSKGFTISSASLKTESSPPLFVLSVEPPR